MSALASSAGIRCRATRRLVQGTLATAIQGAGVLADLQARRELPDAKMERDAPAWILSVLSLVTERIGQLRRVVRNEENPGNLWARHNAVEDPETSGEYPGDIVLFSWGSHRLPIVMWGTGERHGRSLLRPPRSPG